MQIDQALRAQAAEVIEAAQRVGLTIVTAESCTAGLLSNVLSLAPGASKQLHGGFVTYTKQGKTRVLGVSADLLKRKTAVHEDVAVAMAEGALARSPGDIALSVTGVAGPKPDDDGNPVGLVFCAAAQQGAAPCWIKLELGDIGREEISRRTLREAMTLAQKCLDEARQPAAATS